MEKAHSRLIHASIQKTIYEKNKAKFLALSIPIYNSRIPGSAFGSFALQNVLDHSRTRPLGVSMEHRIVWCSDHPSSNTVAVMVLAKRGYV